MTERALVELLPGDGISQNGHTFTKAHALNLCRDWQDLEWGEPHRHTRDNIENAIEELCFAFGCTVEEVRETWWSRRKEARHG